jgi:hypothetical protein
VLGRRSLVVRRGCLNVIPEGTLVACSEYIGPVTGAVPRSTLTGNAPTGGRARPQPAYGVDPKEPDPPVIAAPVRSHAREETRLSAFKGAEEVYANIRRMFAIAVVDPTSATRPVQRPLRARV